MYLITKDPRPLYTPRRPRGTRWWTAVALASAGLALSGCGDRDRAPGEPDGSVASDGGGSTDAGYDPSVGASFDGPVPLDDARVIGLDPGFLPPTPDPCRAPMLVRVTRVIDGDTIVAAEVDGPFSGTVRMIGVDTPELGRDGAPDECFAAESTEFTATLDGRLTWLTFDAECNDRFDRTLAYVWIGRGEQDLWERQLIRRGYGGVLTVSPNDSRADVLAQDELIARRDGEGLWTVCD